MLVMTTQEAIAHFGTQAKLSEKLWCCSPSAISQWGEHPPMLRQFEIQLKTRGRLVAEKSEKKS